MNKKFVLIGLFLIFMLSFNYATADLNNNLISYWNFNETSGVNVIDDINNHSGVNSGFSIDQTGIIDKAYRSDDGTDNIGLGTFYQTDDPFTWNTWVKFNAIPSATAYLSYSRNSNRVFQVRYSASGFTKPSYYIGGTLLEHSDNLGTGTWHMITYTWDGTTNANGMKMYVDGNLSVQGTAGSTGGGTNISYEFGAHSSVGNTAQDVTMDETGYWDTNLGQADITTLWNNGTGNTYPFIPEITTDFNYTIDKELSLIYFQDNSSSGSGSTINDWNWIIDGNIEATTQDFNFNTTQYTDINACLEVATDTGTHGSYCEQFNTGAFYGIISIRTYNEVTGAPLYDVNVNFNGIDYNASNSIDINTTLTNTISENYTITFSKTGYGTRYYTKSLNKFSDVNLDFLLLSTTQGTTLQYRVFKPDQLTPYENAAINIYRPDINNWTIGTYNTDGDGYTSIFTSVFDQNYLFNINDGNEIYQPVALTILFPLDEETSVDIPTNYKIQITGAGSQDFNDVATDQVIYLLPNTIPYYKIKIQDVNENYFPRSYYKSYLGNPLTDTLQPYLISSLTGLLTTIRSVSGTTNQPIPNVNIKIYKDLPAGRVLVEEITTDSKGEALAYAVTGDQYYFEIYYDNTYLRTDTILATSSIIYIRLDDLIYTSQVYGNISATITFAPSNQALSSADKKLTQVIKINDSNSITSINAVLIEVFNTDRNGVVGSTTKIYNDFTLYTDQNTLTNSIDINALNQTLDGVWYDTNGYLQIIVTLITNDTNFTTQFYYKAFTGFSPIYEIGFGSRNVFGCESYYDADGNPNPLIPCGNQLFIALFISFILTAGISFGLKFTSPAGLGIIFSLIMGVFAYLTFVPIVLYGLMVSIVVVTIIVARGRFN